MRTAPPSHNSDESLASRRVSVREVCSGVDALYLSGRAEVPEVVLDTLESLRLAAEASGEHQELPLMGGTFFVAPRSFGKYRYRLEHSTGMVGVTASTHLPAVRVQPYAEFLHGVGPEAAVEFFGMVAEYLVGGPVSWSASRMDLFCDVQGWDLCGDDRSRFVARSERRDLHEHGAAFGGLEFGRRKTKTVCARIYDKTRQVGDKGLNWWPAVWGDRYDPSKPVLRVEVEIGRQGLTEYGVDTPLDALAAVGPLWAELTTSWLTYRTPTDDQTRSRWPVAAEWLTIQGASLSSDAIGAERVRALRRKGELRKIVPMLVGYAARVGALVGTEDTDSTLAAIGRLIHDDELRRRVPFEDRIADRAREDARR